MTENNTAVQYDGDDDLDNVKAPPPRLPALEKGEYELTLEKVVHVDGDNGVFDIFEFLIDKSRGEGANEAGTRAKVPFKRDEKGMKKEIADKRLASCLAALSGGTSPESNAVFIRGLRNTPTGKLRVKIGSAKAEKSGNEYKTYLFYAL